MACMCIVDKQPILASVSVDTITETVPMNGPWIDFAELKRCARFEPVLAHYNLTPSKSGRQTSVLCPFHAEKKPSCKIDLEKRIFHCFGCSAKGNIIDFVARMENATVVEAATTLAEICGIPIDTITKEAPAKREHERSPKASRRPKTARETPDTEETTSPAETSHHEPPVKPDGPINPPLTFALKLDPTHPYLGERGIGADLATLFGLGYCSRGMMKGRIAIPLHDAEGQLVAYAGRWPGEEGWPDGQSKYLLPLGFEKSRVLFNLHRVPESDHVIVVEGYFAAIRLVGLGYPHVVALMGRSLSEPQEALLVARFSRITLLLDGDAPGRNASADILPRLARHLFVRGLELPLGTQPDTASEDLLGAILPVR